MLHRQSECRGAFYALLSYLLGGGLRSILKRFLQDSRETRLTFRHPARVVPPDRVFIVAHEVRDICYWHTALQQNSCEGVTEAMGCRRFLEASRTFKGSGDPSAP